MPTLSRRKPSGCALLRSLRRGPDSSGWDSRCRIGDLPSLRTPGQVGGEVLRPLWRPHVARASWRVTGSAITHRRARRGKPCSDCSAAIEGGADPRRRAGRRGPGTSFCAFADGRPALLPAGVTISSGSPCTGSWGSLEQIAQACLGSDGGRGSGIRCFLRMPCRWIGGSPSLRSNGVFTPTAQP